MPNFGITIPDEVYKRLNSYRQRITREHSLYRDPSRSAVITQAIIEFLDRHEEPEKVETD